MRKTLYTKFIQTIIGFAIGFSSAICIVYTSLLLFELEPSMIFEKTSHLLAPIVFGCIVAVFTILWKTQQKEQKISENQSNKNLQDLLEINFALMSSIDIHEVLQTIIDKSTELINLDTGAIYLYKEDKLYLGATTPHLPDDFPEFMRHDLVANHPIIQMAMRTKSIVDIYDISKIELSETEKAVMKLRNLKSILYIPLIIDNRPVGIMILGTTSEYRNFSQKEKDLYSTFTGQASLSIINAKLYTETLTLNEELSQTIDELKTMNEKLKENAARIEEINEELFSAKEKAEESNRLKTAFFHNMSHEVRTPLNSIVGFSEMLQTPDLSEEHKKKYTNIIISSSFQLLTIVSDILTISSLETKQEKSHPTATCINDILCELHSVFLAQANNKSLTLKLSSSLTDAEATIMVDAQKFTQIVSNLLTNAIKFTHQGSIEFGYTLESDMLKFYVSDTGIGIEKNKHEAIFNRFVQANEKISADYGGTGLGLSICKGLLELLNGNIWVQSAPQEGSTFYFTIPYTHTTTTDSNTLKHENKEISKKTILVAEDQDLNFIYLEVILKNLQYEVLHAKNGQEAVDICKTNENIGLVLMDIKMPILDGYNATKQIKEFKPLLPIIAQTAYASEQEIKKYRDVFDEYLTKPITSKKIAEILHTFLS